MSVPKKSLIGDREVTKKAVIASNAGEPEQGTLKSGSLTAHTMKSKSVRVLKKRNAVLTSFKATN